MLLVVANNSPDFVQNRVKVELQLSLFHPESATPSKDCPRKSATNNRSVWDDKAWEIALVLRANGKRGTSLSQML